MKLHHAAPKTNSLTNVRLPRRLRSSPPVPVQRMLHHLRMLGLLLGLSCSAFIQAAWELPKNLQVHGFLSQGLLYTTDNNFFGNTDDHFSLSFTELGINGSLAITPDLQISAQILSRRGGKRVDGTPTLDYGLLDYRFFSDLSLRMGLRLGRIKQPIGLYNDTRDVAFTRPSTFLPQSIYFDRVRNLELSSDGVQFYSDYDSPLGTFNFQFQVGNPNVERTTKINFIGFDPPGDLNGDPAFFARLLYEHPKIPLRLGVSYGGTRFEYHPAPLDVLQEDDIRVRLLIFSAQYTGENWSLTGEYNFEPANFRNLFPQAPDTDLTLNAFYIQGTYRFLPDFEALLRYDSLVFDRKDRNGNQFEKNTGLPGFTRFSRDWTLGLRWDVTTDFMLRLEYHYIEGTAFLPIPDNPNPFEQKPYWSLYSLQASYRF